MDKFLVWYKQNKENQYMPSYGLKKMYDYNLIKYIYNESSKDDIDIIRLIKIWNKYKNENTAGTEYKNLKNHDLVDMEINFGLNNDKYKQLVEEIPKISDLLSNPFEFLNYSRF